MARRSRPDPKVEALAAARSLNPHPEAVLDEAFATSPFLDPRDLVQVKYEMVRRVRQEGAAVAAAAAAFGFSRPSWYAAAAALDQAGLPGLLPAKPGPRRALRDRRASTLDRTGAGPPPVPQKSPMSTATTPTTASWWDATSSSARSRSPAVPAGTRWGWGW